MLPRSFLAFAVFVAGVNWAAAQEQFPAPPASPQIPTIENGRMIEEGGERAASGHRAWANRESLLWGMKPVCLRVSPLTAGNPADPVPGAFKQAGTVPIMGN